jgi:hypothetical protein
MGRLAVVFWTLRAGIVLLLSLVLLGASTAPLRGPDAQFHRYTAALEFDFLGWTVDAAAGKLGQWALATTGYLGLDDRTAVVRHLFTRIDESERLQADLTAGFADSAEGSEATHAQADELDRVRLQLSRLQPAAEAILAEQAAVILEAEGLSPLGAAFPPVSFRLSQLPVALVVSPRDVIRQDALIQMDPGLPLAQQMTLEARVEREQSVSALVVPVGGIGTYPTMVQETGAMAWVVEVVLHEWTHNLLTLRPLGLSYDASPELRTMNETTAQLMGQALGQRLLARYYPDLLPPPVEPAPPAAETAAPSFDFRGEMHATRVTVDAMLAEGKVAEAEAYMEARRQVFVAHGYNLRRLNQAYFAFYGAYADVPQGAAGEDPIGAAVRALWARAATPAEFLRIMAPMDSVEDLERALGAPITTR